MRHKLAHKQLGRPTDQRLALLRGLVSAVLWHGKVDTTEARAKAARPLAEKMITLALEDSNHRRRQARKFLVDRDLVAHLFGQVGPRFRTRPGGYSRVVRMGVRRGDAAMRARLELVDYDRA
ncbi:MAG TPA: 50S ribosomal protein L17 [Armatimonadota bacterium]|nr:50S ribosomal protein L17 [Armatimonadota bacterium]